MTMTAAVPAAATAYSQECNIQDLACFPIKATKLLGLVLCKNDFFFLKLLNCPIGVWRFPELLFLFFFPR